MKLHTTERLIMRVHIVPVLEDSFDCVAAAAQISIPDRQIFEGRTRRSPVLQSVVTEDLTLDWGQYAFLVHARLALAAEALRELTARLAPADRRQAVGGEALAWTVTVQTSFTKTIASLLQIIHHRKESLITPRIGDHPDPVRRFVDYAANAKLLINALTADLEKLTDGLNDFTHTNLRSIDVNRISLHGLRWSEDTQWDEKVLDNLVRPRSIYIGDGVWQIRDGTAPAQMQQRMAVLL